MNKYEEAFNHILYELNRGETEKQLFSDKEQIEDRMTIKELVDRATPMKPTKKEIEKGFCSVDMEMLICPVCKTIIGGTGEIGLTPHGYKFCPHCGQALDWEV